MAQGVRADGGADPAAVEAWRYHALVNLKECITIANKTRQDLINAVGRSTHNCIFASLVLATRLAQAARVPVQVIRGEVFVGAHQDREDHWWVEVGTKSGPVLIDITADQFNSDVAMGVKPFPQVFVQKSFKSATHHHKSGVQPITCRPGASGVAESAQRVEQAADADCRSASGEASWRRAAAWATKSIKETL